MANRPTIRGVAELAGVSPTTVSLVLNDRADNIPAATRERVMEAVKTLGYRPNANARALGGARSHTIGFITDIIASAGYGGRSVQGAQELCWRNDKLLLIVNTGDDPEILNAAVGIMRDRDVDGIVYAAMSMRRFEVPAESPDDVPTVLMNCYDAEGRYPAVLADEFEGGRTATRALIEAGHRRIAMLRGEPPVDAGDLRFQGYLAALDDAGIPFDPELAPVASWFPAGGYTSTTALMGLPEPPTGIYCVNDWVALGCYEALKEMGLSIPGDVSVVGCDNDELAGLMRPGLTTIQLPHYELGRAAVELLLNPDAPRPQGPVRIACPLVRRDSVRSPRCFPP